MAARLMARQLLQWNQHAKNYSTVRIADGGKMMTVLNGENHSYHSVWLRHNCQCPVCLSSSNQKIVTASNLKKDLRIDQATLKDGKLLIKWKSASDPALNHTGTLCLQWLEENSYSPSSLKKRSEEMEPLLGTELPFVDYSSVMESNEGLWKWLYHLNSVGYCMVSGLPPSVDEVTKVCGRIGNIQNTVHGETFSLKSEENPINIAYTTLRLDLHMDMLYYQSPPGLQALHCLRFDECVEGGESVLLDSLKVINRMRVEFPKQFDTLTKIPATFQDIRFEDYPVKMIYRRPHIVLDRYGRVTKVNWSPVSEGPLSVPESDVEDYYDAYILLDELFTNADEKIVYRLKEGEMIVLNNQRVLHGRREFTLNGGVRHLQGCYVNIDEFLSKFSVLSHQLGKRSDISNIRGGRADAQLYHKIVQLLQKYGTVLTEHVGNPNMDEKGDSHLSDKGIHDRDIEWLEAADVLVAEVTQPSLGVGYEIGRAVAMKKRTLCLFRPESERRLSAMIGGAVDRNFTVVNYKVEDIESIIEKFFK